MEERKPSVAKLVKDLIEAKPVVKEAMTLGIVNYSALARLLTDELERKGFRTSIGAVKMALIRLGEVLRYGRSEFEESVRNVMAGTVISLQSDLTVLTARKSAVMMNLQYILKNVQNARFFQLTQGIETFVIAISREDSERISEILGNGLLEKRDGQAAIVLISPDTILEKPGIVTFITSILAYNGVNITQVISCYRDTILVLDRRDAPRAYQLLEEIIIRMRESVSNAT